MKKISDSFLNMMLAAGFLCLLAGFFMFIKALSDIDASVNIWAVIYVLAGAVIFYISIITYKLSHIFFIGLYMCLSGVFHLILVSGIISYGPKELWPVYGILGSVSIFLTGLARHRRVKSAYLFPSVIILGLGLLFLLFSLDIIKISFAVFFASWWPLLLILLGAALVVLFLYQKSPSSHFPYMTDELKDASVDEVTSADLDGDEQ